MKNLRTLVTKWYVVFPLALILMLESCSKDAINSKSYSGEELFSGIFFGTGEVAGKISEFSSNINSYVTTSEEKQALKNVKEEIISYISLKHPEFFGAFKNNIQSGNVGLVRTSMISAVKLVCEAVKIDYSKVRTSFTKDKIDEIRSDMNKTKSMSSNEKKMEFKTDKYRSILKNMYLKSDEVKNNGEKTNIIQDPDYGTKVATESYLLIFLSVAAVVAAVLIIAVPLVVEPSSASDLNATDKDALYAEHMFATISDNFKLN
ncbi:hypothetical protein [Pedobacter cryoconitis]|uniref:SdpC family antimicrobial peptide n=1 Tax=Pedobacter cryoconitis TaxID=188932 RepID=A0A327RVT6_9SPHI|nr:hypothetical protein [Pedobacter cryoconitis]RAJ19874.1 SdpC family antimicrobial peptide [Pedobacter cryoconitis]